MARKVLRLTVNIYWVQLQLRDFGWPVHSVHMDSPAPAALERSCPNGSWMEAPSGTCGDSMSVVLVLTTTVSIMQPLVHLKPIHNTMTFIFRAKNACRAAINASPLLITGCATSTVTLAKSLGGNARTGSNVMRKLRLTVTSRKAGHARTGRAPSATNI